MIGRLEGLILLYRSSNHVIHVPLTVVIIAAAVRGVSMLA